MLQSTMIYMYHLFVRCILIGTLFVNKTVIQQLNTKTKRILQKSSGADNK